LPEKLVLGYLLIKGVIIMLNRFTQRAQKVIMLAQEEARHKLRFEIEYDDNILKEH